jgi:hypothetical protein
VKENTLKQLIGFIITASLLLVFVSPVLGVPTADLNALAAYYPEKSPILFSFRTDDDYIAALDAVIERINDEIRSADIPSLQEALDNAVGEFGVQEEGVTFAEQVRPWLGDIGAFGVLSLTVLSDENRRNDDEVPVLIALQITDRAAAEAFFDAALGSTPDVIRNETEAFTTYGSPGNVANANIAIGDSVMFVSNEPAALPAGELSASLANKAAFTEALALLPNGDYNITGWVELRELLRGVAARDIEVFSQNVTEALDNAPPLALGAVILNERAFTLDVAVSRAAAEVLAQAQGIQLLPSAPVDTSFLQRVPSGMPLVIHGTDLAAAYQQGLQQLEAQAQMQADMIASLEDEMLPEDMPFNPLQVEQAVAISRFVLQGATGLNLDEELLPALTGDFALYLGLNPAFAETENPMMGLLGQFPLEVGFVTEVNNPEIIPTLVAGLANTFRAIPTDENTQIMLGTDTLGGVEVTTVTILTQDSPFPIELVFGGDEEVFYIGTAAGAGDAFNPDGGLLSDPAWQDASATLLPNSSLVYYLAGEPLLPAAALAGFAGNASREDVAGLRGLLTLLNNSTVSNSYTETAVLSRFVITLPAE